MFRIVVAAAVMAIALADEPVTMGSDVYEVNMKTGEYIVNDAAITVQDNIDVTAASTNQKSASTGASLGKKLAVAELQYKIDEINAATKALEMANVELKTIKGAAAEKQKAGPQLLVDLTKQLNEVASKPAVINGVNDCAEGRCTTTGIDTFVVRLDGEIYADVEGLVECGLTIDGKVYYTPGLGKTTGVTGRHSAVVCEAGPLPPAAVSKKIVSAAVSIRVGGSATLKVATGKKADLALAASGAVLHPHQASTAQPHVFKKADLDSTGTYTMDLLILDPDTKFADVTAVFSGAEKCMSKVELVRIKDVSASMGMGSYHMGIKFTGDAKFIGKELFTLKVSFRDSNNLASNTVELPFEYTAPMNLMIKLCTTRGGKVRSWHDTAFWEAKSGVVNAAAASNHKSYGNDIKTTGYYEAIGPRMDIEFYQGTARKAVASYDISQEFQGVSLRDLVSETKYNSKTIGKKVASRSSGKMRGTILSTNDGGAQPRKGDGFVDTNWDLKVRGRNWGRQNDQWDRISWAFDANSNGHTFGGIGGTHRHGSWRVSYEVMPVVGYCTTWNGYGKENHGYNQPGGGHHPFRHCTRHDALKPIDVAITRGQ